MYRHAREDDLTYLSEDDLLRHVRQLEAEGLSFFPMTCDEIIITKKLCRKGRLQQIGTRVQLALSREDP